jgi:hypothetical protein
LSCAGSNFHKKNSAPHYRIIKAKAYISKSFSIPEVINDSTATPDHEIRYAYDGDQLVSIKTYLFEKDGSFYEYSSDSIIYKDSGNVLILWKKEERNGSFSMKTDKFFESEYYKSIGVVNNRMIPCNDDCILYEHSKKHYELSYRNVVSNVWYCSFHYFLNAHDYVVKYGIESDTNASIIIYEYEQGYNPFNMYYTFSVLKLK